MEEKKKKGQGHFSFQLLTTKSKGVHAEVAGWLWGGPLPQPPGENFETSAGLWVQGAPALINYEGLCLCRIEETFICLLL